MELYILRHGIAEDESASGRDEDRRLTEEGIIKMRRCARVLKTLGVQVNLAVASPYVRTQETARVVMEEWGMKRKVESTEALVPHAPGTEILEVLEGFKAQAVLVVGHEPHLSRLISLLVSGTTDLSITMKKGGCCKLSAPARAVPGTATMEWLLAPKHLLAMSNY